MVLFWSSAKERIRKKRAAAHQVKGRTLSFLESLPEERSHVATDGSLTVRGIQALLESRAVTGVEVVRAFAERSLEVDAEINCLTELNIIQAMHAAKRQDEGKASAKEEPLHGIPISIKDSVALCGLDATLGYSSWSFQPSPNTGLLLGLAMQAGAIPFVKTNVPQTLLSFECDNPLYGRTFHPTHHHLTPGGSSGGEAALIAGGASILGIGSDIGGSLRVPAHFCGIYALKPTWGRLTTMGDKGGHTGQEGIPGVNGPMARHLEDLGLFMKTIIDQKPWDVDPRAVPIPWTPVAPKEKLRVAYYTNDGFSPASPACQRAVMDTVRTLQAQGHECVEMILPPVAEAMCIYYGLVSVDGGAGRLQPIKGDPVIPPIRTLERVLGLWWPTRQLLTWVARRILKDEPTAIVLAYTRAKGTAEEWSLIARRNRYRELFLEAWMALETEAGSAVDCLICPPHALPAFRHDGMSQAVTAISYSALYNVLDLPVGVVPAATFSTELDASSEAEPWTDKPIARTERNLRNLYYGEDLEGAPLGIQVVGRKFREEHVLMCMEVIDRCVSEARSSIPTTSE